MTPSATSADPPPVEHDSRGIIDPAQLQQAMRLTRHPVPEPLAGLIDWFWSVEWDFEPGRTFSQDVLTHPGANISVSPEDSGQVEARVYGVSRELVRRTMSGRGHVVAAMTRPGGLGPFVRTSVADFNDISVPLSAVTLIDADALLDAVAAAPHVARAAEVLGAALVDALDQAVPARLRAALEVTSAARRAETDRGLRRVEDLAVEAGVGVRTLQRLFHEHAGVSPAWVLRRYRLLDAAELVRAGDVVSWSEVAGDLGYADQAHLVREFRAAIGRTPAAYAAEMRAATSSNAR